MAAAGDAPSDAPADVVVIGAGLAGLACALRLRDASPKLRVVVLEARKLVGGRASKGGADFVHGEAVATWRYIERFGMKADGSLNGWAEPPDPAQPGKAECWAFVNGELKGPERVHSEPNCLFFKRAADLAEEWILAGKPDTSMREVLRQGSGSQHPPTEDELRLMEMQLAEWYAADLADVSVYEEDYCSEQIQALARNRPALVTEDGEEGHWRILGGHQGLAERMVEGQDLHLETIVQSIEWSDGQVRIGCAQDRVFHAKAAVVTVPLACVPDLHFDPALPASKRLAVDTLGVGVTTTVYLRFRERFWPERLGFLFHSMSSQCFWPGRASNVLTCYFGGATSNRHLLALSDGDMVGEILRQLAVIFDKPVDDMRALLAGSDVCRWDTDPFAKMSYSYGPPGTPKRPAGTRNDLGAACPPLFWGGEATHPTKNSFAHGALEEGERAADEVLAYMSGRAADVSAGGAKSRL